MIYWIHKGLGSLFCYIHQTILKNRFLLAHPCVANVTYTWRRSFCSVITNLLWRFYNCSMCIVVGFWWTISHWWNLSMWGECWSRNFENLVPFFVELLCTWSVIGLCRRAPSWCAFASSLSKTMSVTRLLGTTGVVGLYGTVVGVTRLEIKLPLILNIVCINFGSKSASHSWDPSLLIATNYVSWRRGLYTTSFGDPWSP